MAGGGELSRDMQAPEVSSVHAVIFEDPSFLRAVSKVLIIGYYYACHAAEVFNCTSVRSTAVCAYYVHTVLYLVWSTRSKKRREER